MNLGINPIDVIVSLWKTIGPMETIIALGLALTAAGKLIQIVYSIFDDDDDNDGLSCVNRWNREGFWDHFDD